MKNQRRLRPLPSRFLVGHMAAFSLLFAFGQVVLANPPRVSVVEGTTFYEPADEVEISELTVNLPLLTGDRIYASDNGRIEIQQGPGNFVLVGPNTDLKWLGTDDVVRIELTSGDLIFKVLDLESHKIFTPFASIRIKTPGIYRVSVGPEGAVQVAVREGSAEVANRLRVREISAGEQIVVDQVQSGLTQVSLWSDLDSFDLWSQERDQIFQQAASVTHLDPSYTSGVVELDHHGSWDYVADYGDVWFPTVTADFAPYRLGRWANYPRWGWTWISYEPWGWLPYHSGQWIYYRPYSRWCWVPGGSYLWSGALVDFYYGSGYVGWAPRGHRGWGSSRRYGSGFGLSLSTSGFSFVLQTDFGHGRVDQRLRRDVRNRGWNFREGLPPDLSSRQGGRNVVRVGRNPNEVDRSERNSQRSGGAITDRLLQDARRPSSTTESGLSRWADRNRTPQTDTPARVTPAAPSASSPSSIWSDRQRSTVPRVIGPNSTITTPERNPGTVGAPRSSTPPARSSGVDRTRTRTGPSVIPNRATAPNRNNPPSRTVIRSAPRGSVSPPSGSDPRSVSPPSGSDPPSRSAPSRSPASRRPPPKKP